MDTLDLHVLRTLRDWRQQGRRAMLATVVQTWGSSPRPVGSIMALRDDGAVVGSVSGGCIEDDLIQRYREAIPDGPPQRCSYGVNANEAHRFGLPCGGTLELVLEFQPNASDLAALVQQLDQGAVVLRQLHLHDGTTQQQAAPPSRPPLVCDQQTLSQVFGPGYRLLIIGAGQISEYLATMALFSGFAVSLCDPREEHRSHWAVAGVHFLPGMPDDVVDTFRPDQRSAIVALTHDPKLDDLALLSALQSPAFYVGAIGSRRNQTARQQRLREQFDLPEQAWARLHGPMGLHIGSKTPAEIAVSTMAELIACRNQVSERGCAFHF